MISADENFNDRYVCVMGLGYVGLTLALALADVGFKVVGVEIRDEVLRKLKMGEAHFYEPGLRELLRRLVREQKIKFTKRIPYGTRATVYIITVGTPLMDNGRVRLDMIESVAREVANHLKRDDMVILRSTVKLGTTTKIVNGILKSRGVHFDLAFCPERTLEGQALKELRQLPQIVGGKTVRAAVRAGQIFQFLTPTVVRVSNLETAEMIKLIDNAQRDVSFAYANEVARICDKMGVSAVEVIQAGKLGYPRTNLPMPGLVGGPCLMKDPYILAEGCREAGLEPELTIRARRINENQPDEVIKTVASVVGGLPRFPKRPVIALLGIAFKGRPLTDDLRGTMAKPVLESIKRRFPNAVLKGYDPVVQAADIRSFGVTPVSSLTRAFKGTNLAVILNNHPDFSAMPVETLAAKMARPAMIYDFWNSFSGVSLRLPSHVGYMALGHHAKKILPK